MGNITAGQKGAIRIKNFFGIIDQKLIHVKNETYGLTAINVPIL